MGESRRVRAGLIAQLAAIDPPPESVPINNLVPVAGTPLAGVEPLDPLEFVRTIAATRLTLPRSMVRLSAGRQQLSEAVQALCFFAGANSIFYGEKLLTTPNPEAEGDRALFKKLGIKPIARVFRRGVQIARGLHLQIEPPLPCPRGERRVKAAFKTRLRSPRPRCRQGTVVKLRAWGQEQANARLCLGTRTAPHISTV